LRTTRSAVADDDQVRIARPRRLDKDPVGGADVQSRARDLLGTEAEPLDLIVHPLPQGLPFEVEELADRRAERQEAAALHTRQLVRMDQVDLGSHRACQADARGDELVARRIESGADQDRLALGHRDLLASLSVHVFPEG
jgi:hypothetical protein